MLHASVLLGMLGTLVEGRATALHMNSTSCFARYACFAHCFKTHYVAADFLGNALSALLTLPDGEQVSLGQPIALVQVKPYAAGKAPLLA